MTKNWCDLCGELADYLYGKSLTVSCDKNHASKRKFYICRRCKDSLKRKKEEVECQFVHSSKEVRKQVNVD